MATAAPEMPVLARDQAFEYLYRRYVKDVYHYALALLRNPADAEDVTQTTFLNAYRAYQSGIQIEKPHNWLIKIAHNVARTRYARAGRRVKEVPLEDHVEQLAVPEAERPDVTGVLRALGRLPFNQRAALVMRELEGRSYAEIADTIGVSVSAVETLIFRARKSLRLKASALRALAAVPLPNSLTQLIDGGGVVAGGGAVVGTGFLLKAAAALVAGAVATGMAVGHRGPTGGAAGSITRFASGEPSPRADGFTARPSSFTIKPRQIARQDRVRAGSASTSAGRAAHVGGLQAVPTRPQAPAGTPDTQTSSSAGASQVPSQVAGLASTTEKAAEAPVPALPVQAPGLPPVPVDLPKIPGTPLPVQVPSLPPVPVVVPKVPAPPPLP
jgi:RNA polymerase sigma factor (sigma-70 family)